MVRKEEGRFVGRENVSRQGGDAEIIVDNQDREHTRRRRVRVMAWEEVGGSFLEEEEDGTVVIRSPYDRAGVDAAPLGRVQVASDKPNVYPPLPSSSLYTHVTH